MKIQDRRIGPIRIGTIDGIEVAAEVRVEIHRCSDGSWTEGLQRLYGRAAASFPPGEERLAVFDDCNWRVSFLNEREFESISEPIDIADDPVIVERS